MAEESKEYDEARIDRAVQTVFEQGHNKQPGTVCDGGRFRPVNEVKPIHSINAQDLLKEYIAPLEYLVDKIIPAVGLAMLGAPSKYYKSYMCVDMGLCVAEGVKFLGFDTKKSGVLYMDLESTKRRPKTRIEQVLNGAKCPDNLHIVTAEQKVGKIGEGLEQQIEWQLQEFPDIGFVIIDVLKKVRPVQKRGQNDYDRDYEDLGRLKEFADSRNICILVIHHTRKMKDPDDPFNELAGSSGVMGVLDAALVISKKKREDKDAKLYITGRDMPEQVLAIEFNKSIFRWENLGDSESVEHNRQVNKYRNSKAVQVIKRLIEQGNGELTASVDDIIQASNWIGGGVLKIYDTPQAVGKELSGYVELFNEVDNIEVSSKRNGKKREYLYKTHVTHVTNVTCTQQSLNL
nr:MAG TPA_asm: replicative DNA helicase [Caudoviricetes sp.]